MVPEPLLAELEPSLAELLLDAEAEGNDARVFLAVLGMVAAQGDELLTHWAASVGLALAGPGVHHDPLHLLAVLLRAGGIAALAGVLQGLDAALDGQAPTLPDAPERRLPLVAALIGLSIQAQPHLHHLVGVALGGVAAHAKVVGLALGAVPAGLHLLLALTAGVDSEVLALALQLPRHR